ncbi:MAG: inositol monophosphatase [Bacteroidales bacterium]|nr:inositol monophosphatase [Lachnoclostridium sp.]MCM1385578.1 inositol monophosphatase [Lachnoclostridium sp.]MCM1465579.1 inositol monophosphatase [Bacteroidales bacterium]
MSKHLLEQVKSLVLEAGRFCGREQLAIYSKGGNSNFVTTADINVENFLKEKLPPLLPGSSFIGEESDHNLYDREYLWIVDPIDGTSNFIRELKLSAVSVGLVHNGEPILGVVYNPFTKDMYSAQKGQGAFLNDKPIHVSDRDFAHGHFCTAFSLYKKELAPPCFRILERVYKECDDMRRLGSAALELCTLASGGTELYFEIRLFPWDYCGALAILKEAGGHYTAVPTNQELFQGPTPLVAANSEENLERLLEIVKEELRPHFQA